MRVKACNYQMSVVVYFIVLFRLYVGTVKPETLNL
jgi:hypothetical protein